MVSKNFLNLAKQLQDVACKFKQILNYLWAVVIKWVLIIHWGGRNIIRVGWTLHCLRFTSHYRQMLFSDYLQKFVSDLKVKCDLTPCQQTFCIWYIHNTKYIKPVDTLFYIYIWGKRWRVVKHGRQNIGKTNLTFRNWAKYIDCLK